MAAQIIAFPKRTQVTPQQDEAQVSAAPRIRTTKAQVKEEPGLHLVEPGAKPAARSYEASQLQALRIVEDIRKDMKHRPMPAAIIISERSPQFWAALPIPEPQVDTPLAVTRRLVHLLLSTAEIA